jgi:hypothetical protein
VINTISIIGGLKKPNIQKPVVFLYANNEHAEKETRKIIPFTIASKNNKISNQGCERCI